MKLTDKHIEDIIKAHEGLQRIMANRISQLEKTEESIDSMIDEYDEMAVDLAKYCGVLIKADSRDDGMVSTEEARKYADWTAYCQIVQVLNKIRGNDNDDR